MTNNRYNGWANRNTWLVALHFGDDQDTIDEMVKESRGDVDILADWIKAMVLDYIEEQTKDMFVSDLIDTGCIDWAEIAWAWRGDYTDPDPEDYACPGREEVYTDFDSAVAKVQRRHPDLDITGLYTTEGNQP